MIRQRMSLPVRPRFTHFYIDANCIIYNCLASLGSNCSLDELLRDVCRYIDLLVHLAKPSEVLLIAVDGPAPLAKCQQQRSRRFVAARDHSGGFDKTQISVGTEFMERLHEVLVEFIDMKTRTDHIWQKPQVVYSSHRVPGEGEHKVFDLLRVLKEDPDFSKNTTHCVYSPDGDLIFLCLQSRLPYFYIMKEWDSWIGPNERVGNGKLDKMRVVADDFELVNLSLVRDYMKFDYAKEQGGHIDLDRVIDDYAAFSMLLGDDFIPHFPDVSIQSGHYGIIVQCYQEGVLNQGKYLVENGELNKTMLASFLKMLVERLGSGSGKGKSLGFNGNDPQAVQNYLLRVYPEEMAKNPEEFEKELAFDILDSFDWVLEYYTKGCPSWTWRFPKWYPPPLAVVAKYCAEHQSHFELDRPPYPFEQLLCVMPPQSACFLPPAAAMLMVDPSPLAQFYPTDFRIDLNGAKFEHDGIVLLPSIDVKMVREAVEQIEDQFTEEEKKRNTWGKLLRFANGSHTESDYSQLKSFPHEDKPGCIIGLGSDSGCKMPVVFTKKQCVKVFNRKSDGFSMHITVDARQFGAIDFQKVQSLVNKVVLASWPILQPALVVKAEEKEIAQGRWEEQRAMSVQGTKFGITCRAVRWIDSAETVFAYGPPASAIYESTIPCSFQPDRVERFKAPEVRSVEVGMPAVIVNGPNKGKVGKVVAVQDSKVTIQPREILDIDWSSAIRDDKTEWRPLEDIADALGCNEETVRNLLTTVETSLGGDKRADVAFTGLSLERPMKVLDGFVKMESDHIFVTEYFMSKLWEYLDLPCVGQLKQLVMENQLPRFQVKALDLFGTHDRMREVAPDLQRVRKELLCQKYFLRVASGLSLVSQATLEKMEHQLTSRQRDQGSGDAIEADLDDVVWPGKPKCVVQKLDEYQLGRRVVNLSSALPVPVGATGTIVAKSDITFDILLDDEYPYATKLRRRLRTNRGLTAKVADLYVL